MVKAIAPSPVPLPHLKSGSGGEKKEQLLVLCQTCSVLSGHACILPVDRGNLSFVNQLRSLKWEEGR